MRPITANGYVWRVVRVNPDDPRLIDRQGRKTVGTTNPATMEICISEVLVPPELDRVLLHEVAHAVTMSYGLIGRLHDMIPKGSWILVEEWAAQLVENHAIEAAVLATESIGRPLCVRGFCNG